MTFRSRVALTFVLAALVPVAILGLGVRREMLRRFDAEAGRRVDALVRVLRADLAADLAASAARLHALAQGLADDNRFRLAEAGGDRRWLIDWGTGALRASGLAMLQLHDSAGRILSSGQFRSDFDRVAPALPDAAVSTGEPVLARIRVAEGTLLALVAGDTFAVAGRRYRLVGGTIVDSARLARLAPDPEIAVALMLGGEDPATTVGDVPLRYIDDPAGTTGIGRLVITRDPGPAAELLRRVDRWIVIALLATLGGAAALALWLAGFVSAPVAELARKTERLDLERLDQDFGTDRTDELGALSRLLDQMTRRLRTGALRLREAERRATVGDMARQVTHDIKNGLAPIRHVLRHLSETAEREPERLAPIFLERKETLDASVGYLDQLARSYAKLAPATGGSSTDLGVLLRELGSALGTERVTIAVAVPAGTPRVAADPLIVRRIVENLVVNAIEALPDGAGRVDLSAVGDGGVTRRVRLAVADGGRGMSAEELERAFDDFYTTKPQGTGLGLSVVRRLAGDIGGSVRIETGPGRGTTVFVEMPAA